MADWSKLPRTTTLVRLVTTKGGEDRKFVATIQWNGDGKAPTFNFDEATLAAHPTLRNFSVTNLSLNAFAERTKAVLNPTSTEKAINAWAKATDIRFKTSKDGKTTWEPIDTIREWKLKTAKTPKAGGGGSAKKADKWASLDDGHGDASGTGDKAESPLRTTLTTTSDSDEEEEEEDEEDEDVAALAGGVKKM